ncbi:hypothetical protein ACFO1B_29330 [Dactylosporangium siamense]|nr:sialidase family protein [Dactylosporangium siamense]
MREQLDEIAAAAPPSRLSADAVYAAAFRRRHRRVAAWVGGGVVAGALAVSLAAGALGLPPATPMQAPRGDGRIFAVAAADAEHLYAEVGNCGGGCTLDLVGSDDGGRSWTVRTRNLTGDLSAPAPGSLLRMVETGTEGPLPLHVPWVSRDGGRSWAEVRAGGGAVAEVAAGGWLQCASPRGINDPCTLIAVDPVNARSAPLAGPPDLFLDEPVDVPVAGGFWVTGRDRGGQRPAVAVSRDRGRTWSTHVFTATETGDADLDMLRFMGAASTDGVNGYTIMTAADPKGAATAGVQALVFRTGDAGNTWQRVHPTQTLPRRYYIGGDSYVAADGSHVVLGTDDPPDRWYTSSDGGNSYHPASQPGLGAELLQQSNVRVVVAAAGAYLAFDAGALYRSADGLRWTRTVIRLD